MKLELVSWFLSFCSLFIILLSYIIADTAAFSQRERTVLTNTFDNNKLS